MWAENWIRCHRWYLWKTVSAYFIMESDIKHPLKSSGPHLTDKENKRPILEVRREPGALAGGGSTEAVFMHWRRHEIAVAGRKHCWLNPQWAGAQPEILRQSPPGHSQVWAKKQRWPGCLLSGTLGVIITCPGSDAGMLSLIFLKSLIKAQFYLFCSCCICLLCPHVTLFLNLCLDALLFILLSFIYYCFSVCKALCNTVFQKSVWLIAWLLRAVA